MKLSNSYGFTTVGCERPALAIRAAAFALLLGAAVPLAAQTAPAQRLFASGFEGTTAIVPPNQANFWGTGGWSDITGSDNTTGFTWPPNLWGGGGARFLFLTDPLVVNVADIGTYMFNRIETVTGPKGNPTQTLYQEISRNVNGTEPMGTSPTTNLFMITPNGETSDLYVSYWIKLQPDLVEKMNNLPAGPGIVNGGTWRAFFAFKTGTQKPVTGPLNDPMDNGDYRIEVYVMTYGGGAPYWQVLADNNAGGGAPLVNNWSVQNRTVPVPVGEWFKFEFFLHRSNGADGRVRVAVNGNVIADQTGPNMGAWNLPINRISMPTVYTGSRMPVYQWIDDLEIWNGFPPVGSPAPTVALSAAPATIAGGQSTTLSWSSTDAASCAASGSWSGAKALSGSETAAPSANATYTLSCTGAGGSTAKSATVTVTTPSGDTQPPPVPTGLVGSALSSTQIKLSWNPSTDNVGVAGYYVYLNDVALATTTATSFTHSGLAAGVTYHYRVSAYDAVPNHSAWSATPVSVKTPARRAVRGDVNGDGKSDILWRNGATGENAIWLMGGAAAPTNAPIDAISDLDWGIAGVGDFDGDGKSDIVWRHGVTGELSTWFMNGATILSRPVFGAVADLNWAIAGVADFDGDGKSDIVWHNNATGSNSLWLMSGTTIWGGATQFATVPDLNWGIAGVGDFDGDGKSDIAWRNRVTGENAAWLMNGATILSRPALPAVPDLNWSIAGGR
ncbi:MAG: FG-GAP-like repeat-containing protein [Burkholderiales bacterium]